MHHSRALISRTCFVGLTLPFATAPTPSAACDAPPELKSSEILQSSHPTNPTHRAREAVKTRLGLNRQAIDLPFGTFVAQGNQMLQESAREQQTPARMSRSTAPPASPARSANSALILV